MPSKPPLQVRHAAALKLVKAGELDPVLALSLVVWPPKRSRLDDEHMPRERRVYPEELKAELRARHAAGETMPMLAQSTGIPWATIKMWCSPTVQKRAREREAERGLRLF